MKEDRNRRKVGEVKGRGLVKKKREKKEKEEMSLNLLTKATEDASHKGDLGLYHVAYQLQPNEQFGSFTNPQININ